MDDDPDVRSGFTVHSGSLVTYAITIELSATGTVTTTAMLASRCHRHGCVQMKPFKAPLSATIFVSYDIEQR